MKLRPSICLLLALLAALGSALEVEFVTQSGGQIYPLRWGLADTNDSVAPYPRWGKPLCIKQGSPLGIRIIWGPGETPGYWAVPYSELRSKVTGFVHWYDPDCAYTHGLHAPGATHWFSGPVPSYIEWAELTGVIVVPNENQPPGGDLGEEEPPAYSDDVFVVLDEPTWPMSPPWVTILVDSCTWANGKSTSLPARQALTQKLHQNGFYDPSFAGYTLWNDQLQEEHFYPNAFKNDVPSYHGQCNDFADYLTCITNSVGAGPMWATRSYSYNDVFWGGPNDSSGWKLETNLGIRAGATQAASEYFTYHQFGVVQDSGVNNVWDGAMKQADGTYFINLARDSTYQVTMVNYYDRYYNWQIVQTVNAPSTPPWVPESVYLKVHAQ